MEMIDDSLKRLGHRTIWIELEEITTENELIRKIRDFSPDFLFSLTANPQLTKVVPDEYLIIHYELDKVMAESLLKKNTFKKRDFIFSTYKNDCKKFKNAGAGQVLYLAQFPERADPETISEAAVDSLVISYIPFSLGLWTIGALFLIFYPISRERHERNVEMLRAREAEARDTELRDASIGAPAR